MHVGYTLLFQSESISLWSVMRFLVTKGIAVYLYLQLHAMAQPEFSPTGELVHGGSDIHAEGLAS